MEVEIEGPVAAEIDVQAPHGLVPAVHEPGAQARVDAARIFRQAGPPGRGVEAGEQGDSRIHRVRHDVGRPSDAPELEGQERAEGMAGRDHRAPRHAAVADDGVEVEPRQVGSDQEQPAELGAKPPGRQVEHRGVGDRGGLRAGRLDPVLRWAARQLREPGLPQDPLHGGLPGLDPLRREPPADVGRREVRLPAQLDRPLVPPPGVRPLPPGSRSRAPAGEEEGCVRVPAELGTEVAEGAVAVSKAPGRLDGACPVDEMGPEGLVAPMRRRGGLEEDVADLCHVNMRSRPFGRKSVIRLAVRPDSCQFTPKPGPVSAERGSRLPETLDRRRRASP